MSPTPTPEDGWQLEACCTCGSLVLVRYDEDGTPEYKKIDGSVPLFPLPDMDIPVDPSVLEDTREIKEWVDTDARALIAEYHQRYFIDGEKSALEWLKNRATKNLEEKNGRAS